MNLEGVVNVLNKVGKGTAIGVGGLGVVYGGFLGLAAVSGIEIVHPWTPPTVEVSSNVIRVESRGWTGPHLTKWYDGGGGTKIEWFEPDIFFDIWNYWRDYPEYVDSDGDGLVDFVKTGSPATGYKDYERKKDLAQHHDVFARADREFNEVLKRYGPYITQVERSLF